MRSILFLLALTACAPEPPQPRLAGDAFVVEAPFAICSYDGQEALIYTLSDGTVTDPIPTGKGCDYQEYRSYLSEHGEYPRARWGMEGYENWRRRTGRTDA